MASRRKDSFSSPEEYQEFRAEQNAQIRKWRAKNREKFLAYMRDRYHANKDKINEACRERKRLNPTIHRLRNKQYLYGIEPEQYEKQLADQQGFCAICKRPESKQNRSLSVDHNHTTGQIRDLLCSNCNTALGLVREDPSTLHAMLQYLEKHNASILREAA